jgi:hypothetical protein
MMNWLIKKGYLEMLKLQIDSHIRDVKKGVKFEVISKEEEEDIKRMYSRE